MSIRMICVSHTPLMDYVKVDSSVDRHVRDAFAKLGAEVRAYGPEVIVLFAPDHFKGFFYDMLPAFTIGIRAEAIGDYDIGSGNFVVPEDLALDCVNAVRAQDVDVAVSYRMQADHGFAQPLVLLGGNVDAWPVIPIHINCAGPPLPSFRRVQLLGEAVGRWASGLNKRVLILGSGGLSHDPPIPNLQTASPASAEMLIAGRNPPMAERRAREDANVATARKLARGEGDATPLNPEWDLAFMAQMAARDFGQICGGDDAELTRIAGCGAHEVRAWVAAYAAMGAAGPFAPQHILYHPIPEWNAGMGIATAMPAAA